MLKSRHASYDGQGIFRLSSPADILETMNKLQTSNSLDDSISPLDDKTWYIEKAIPFTHELAVIVVSKRNEYHAFPCVEVINRDNACHLVFAPPRNLSQRIQIEAQLLAKHAVASLVNSIQVDVNSSDCNGVYGVEMFLTQDYPTAEQAIHEKDMYINDIEAELYSTNTQKLPWFTAANNRNSSLLNQYSPDDELPRLLINEIAPRPHNTGHYTIEACNLSQFAAHLRCVLDLPLPISGLTMRCPAAIMINILSGATVHDHLPLISTALSVPTAHVHMYGKSANRPGRKIGHITVTGDSLREAESAAAPLIRIVDEIYRNRVNGLHNAPLIAPTIDPVRLNDLPLVGIVSGSQSDQPILQNAYDLLLRLNIPFEKRITSAHRTPELMARYARSARQRGLKIIIAAAGGAAHLPGMIAAFAPDIPVIGVPIRSLSGNSGSTNDWDALLSLTNMPKGVPVLTVGVNNATNAVLGAARILSLHNPNIRQHLRAYIASAARDSIQSDTVLSHTVL